jgi:hypothetical protein
MTNSTIDNSKIILFDKFPGVPSTVRGLPVDGFTGADHHNVLTPYYPIGTKIQVYDVTNKGYATMIYLQYIAGTKAATLALAAGQFCCPPIAANASSGQAAVNVYYKVTDDASEALVQGPIAVALSAMTTTYYGWFWCGGVCPISFVTALDTTFTTNGDLGAGLGVVGIANASATSTYSDKIILGLAMTGAAHNASVVFDAPAAGMSLVADA